MFRRAFNTVCRRGLYFNTRRCCHWNEHSRVVGRRSRGGAASLTMAGYDRRCNEPRLSNHSLLWNELCRWPLSSRRPPSAWSAVKVASGDWARLWPAGETLSRLWLSYWFCRLLAATYPKLRLENCTVMSWCVALTTGPRVVGSGRRIHSIYSTPEDM